MLNVNLPITHKCYGRYLQQKSRGRSWKAANHVLNWFFFFSLLL